MRVRDRSPGIAPPEPVRGASPMVLQVVAGHRPSSPNGRPGLAVVEQLAGR
jgi:hypothetical protein